METATIPQQGEVEETTATQLNRYSSWVHVGPGAEQCAEGEAGSCEDPLHFHAWCRLPNQFQKAKIREKALGARARMARRLHDPESDGYAILEAEFDQLRSLDDRDAIVEELLQRDWPRDYMEALEDVAETESETAEEDDGEPVLIYEHIERDRQRYVLLDDMDPEARPTDEYEELKRQLTKHKEAVDKRLEAIVAPKREVLEAKDIETLIGILRDERIAAESHQHYMAAFSLESWYVGTRVKEHSAQLRFANIEQLEDAAPEVVDALREMFNDLESTQDADAKNS